jgi:hypothetical protein
MLILACIGRFSSRIEDFVDQSKVKYTYVHYVLKWVAKLSAIDMKHFVSGQEVHNISLKSDKYFKLKIWTINQVELYKNLSAGIFRLHSLL